VRRNLEPLGEQWRQAGHRRLQLHLSKRTKVYAFYTQVDEDSNGTLYVSGTPGSKFSSLALGVRHSF